VKEPASNSLTDEAVEVPNGGLALHGSHPLLAEAIWKKKEKTTTTRACHVLCSFLPFAFKKTWLFAKLQVLVSHYKKKALSRCFFASHRLYDALIQSPAALALFRPAGFRLARLCSPSL
jgi:hypothetical protein